jgi:hypothetical protein
MVKLASAAIGEGLDWDCVWGGLGVYLLRPVQTEKKQGPRKGPRGIVVGWAF